MHLYDLNNNNKIQCYLCFVNIFITADLKVQLSCLNFGRAYDLSGFH